MNYQVFIPSNPDPDMLFDEHANYAMWWNVHSDYNDGFRATNALWHWMVEHGIEVDQWDIEASDRDGCWFLFEQHTHAALFKLCWEPG